MSPHMPNGPEVYNSVQLEPEDDQVSLEVPGSPRRARDRFGEKESGVLGQFGQLVLLRLIVAFALLWAVLAIFWYPQFLDYFALGRVSIELKWTIFCGLSLAGAVLAAAFVFAGFHLLMRIYRSTRPSN